MRGKRIWLASILTVLASMLLFAGTTMAADAAGEVDINAASKAQLKTLKGVGDALADRILEYREKNGPFKKPEDLMNVKGIGASIFDKNKGRIVVGAPVPAKETPKTGPEEAEKPKENKPKS
jgi:competence protein ComEA